MRGGRGEWDEMCKGVHEHALGEIGTRDSLYLFCNCHKQSPCVECSGQQQVPGGV